MSDVVHYEKHGAIGVITLDKPPVNALGAVLRQREVGEVCIVFDRNEDRTNLVLATSL